MDINEALTNIQRIIDGATKAGLFQQAKDCIIAQQSFDTVTEHLKEVNHGGRRLQEQHSGEPAPGNKK